MARIKAPTPGQASASTALRPSYWYWPRSRLVFPKPPLCCRHAWARAKDAGYLYQHLPDNLCPGLVLGLWGLLGLINPILRDVFQEIPNLILSLGS